MDGTPDDDRNVGGIWDRIWRGRASSHRRNLDNCALETARGATLIHEAARLVDQLPTSARQVELIGIADEIAALAESMIAVAHHLRGEAGGVPIVPRVSLPQRFARWLLGDV